MSVGYEQHIRSNGAYAHDNSTARSGHKPAGFLAWEPLLASHLSRDHHSHTFTHTVGIGNTDTEPLLTELFHKHHSIERARLCHTTQDSRMIPYQGNGAQKARNTVEHSSTPRGETRNPACDLCGGREVVADQPPRRRRGHKVRWTSREAVLPPRWVLGKRDLSCAHFVLVYRATMSWWGLPWHVTGV
jgi:hypothetical protein